MSTQKEPFYITTAIAYVNGSPHIGHAYEMILTDAMARYKRACGHDVYFLTGTDEHGQKIAQTAEAQGKNVRDFCDGYAAEFQKLTLDLNISNDGFIRTTEERHYKASQALWQTLQERGDIYLEKYAGWYSVRDEAYFGEDELTKDESGDLIAPTGAKVAWMEQPSYFFRLSHYQEKLLDLYRDHPDFIQPSARRNEIIKFVEAGLTDLSISRTSFDWGIPVKDDPDHVMYVWLDALTNYITALGYPDKEDPLFQKFWPANIHVIGKDITRFHCIYWPAFLMAADLPLPKQVFGHGFINIEGQKMSKSLGNVVAPDLLIERYGRDGMRYFLLREIAHGDDGNYAHDQALLRINADLANGLGNLVQRSLSMIFKNCDARIPHSTQEKDIIKPEDTALLNALYDDLPKQIAVSMDKFHVHRALESIWVQVAAANAYIDTAAPWTLKKTDEARMRVVLSVLAESIRVLGISISPFLPELSDKILAQLNLEAQDYSHINSNHALKSGHNIPEPQGVFQRLEK
jgi:methionyl-tRNA synthetase